MKSELVSSRFLSVNSRVPDLAGFFGYHAYIAQQFLRACEAIGIPATPDVNTSKGTMGVTEVMGISSPNKWLIKADLHFTVKFVGRFICWSRLTDVSISDIYRPQWAPGYLGELFPHPGSAEAPEP